METQEIDTRTLLTDTLEVKRDKSSGKMQIQGYALKFNVPSNSLPFIEYIKPSALDGVDFSHCLLLYAHNTDNILAREDSGTLQTVVDDVGLLFTATLPDTTIANDVYKNIEAGNLKGCSFSMKIAKNGDSMTRNIDGTIIHNITKIDRISEITITSIPAYNSSSVEVKRSLNKIKKEGVQKIEMEENEEFKTAVANFMSAFGSNFQERSMAGTDTKKEKKMADPFKVGETVILKADHMPGMQGAMAKIDAVNNGAYEVDYWPTDGSEEVKDHKWVTADEMETTDKPYPSAVKTQKRDDEDDSGNDDGGSDDSGSDEEDREDNSSDETSPENKKDNETQNEDSEKRDSSSGDDTEAPEDGQSNSDTVGANNNDNEGEGDENKEMTRELGQSNKNEEVTRDFHDMLVAGEVKRDVTGGVGLQTGATLIPDTILPAEKETHQFPRLADLIRTITVKTTTGKLPVFQEQTGTLSEHAEFSATSKSTPSDVKPINWDLGTYTGAFAYSQELIQDSDYNWESELGSELRDLQNNTDDGLIVKALVKDVTPVKTKDLVSAIKTALNVNLKPIDSANASIILSQAAFNMLDQMKDNEGRSLIQPDLTKASNYALLGKSLVVIDDVLFPNAKAGDVNAIVAPLKKAVIKFMQSQIQGKFQDNYENWYSILGLFYRCDVEQARKDLVTLIQQDTTADTPTDGE
ncbi:phage major capsid protein [Liquorilactobacillus uvarum]|nr:phage major capsid protein [Liquorilactobacillus uvarum]